MKHSKRYNQACKVLDENKKEIYPLREAVEMLKKIPGAKFDETVDIVCRLNVDYRKSDQMVRGSCVLPHGTGKEVTVLVFCKGEKEKEAKDAGADYVGLQEYVEKIEKGWLGFDYCIATPDIMRDIGKLGKVLGPRGLMPSGKTGSVTFNIANAVKEAKQGKIDFRMDKTGVVHSVLGKNSFSVEQICENTRAFLNTLMSSRPSSAKGAFIGDCHMSTTMSPSVIIDWKTEVESAV